MDSEERIRAAAKKALAEKFSVEEENPNPGRAEAIYKEQEEMFSGNDVFSDPFEETEEIVDQVNAEKETTRQENQTSKKDIVSDEVKAFKNEVIWQGHPSWRGMVGYLWKGILVWLIVSLILYGLIAAGVVSATIAVLLSVFLLAGVIVVARLIIKTTVYTITRSQVSERRGIINTVSEQARLEQITNIQIKRNFYDRLVGIGKVDIDTASDVANLQLAQSKGLSKAKNILDWWGVKNPYQIQTIIDDLRLEQL
jgi:uncharacterized membrane protein YdbT with pleckstrin-like domain